MTTPSVSVIQNPSNVVVHEQPIRNVKPITSQKIISENRITAPTATNQVGFSFAQNNLIGQATKTVITEQPKNISFNNVPISNVNVNSVASNIVNNISQNKTITHVANQAQVDGLGVKLAKDIQSSAVTFSDRPTQQQQTSTTVQPTQVQNVVQNIVQNNQNIQKTQGVRQIAQEVAQGSVNTKSN